MISFFTSGILLTIMCLTSMMLVGCADSTEGGTTVVTGRALQDDPIGTGQEMCFTDSKVVGEVVAIPYPFSTYNFYSCKEMGVTKRPCTCMLTRTITVDRNQIFSMYVGEYLSLSECNKNCGRGQRDKCWFCDKEQVWIGHETERESIGHEMIHLVSSCKHVQDVFPTYVPVNQRFRSTDCWSLCHGIIKAECNTTLVPAT